VLKTRGKGEGGKEPQRTTSPQETKKGERELGFVLQDISKLAEEVRNLNGGRHGAKKEQLKKTEKRR